jgi:hypothetical protein
MSLINEVCSPLSTQKLVALGLVPASNFYWVETMNGRYDVCCGGFEDDPRSKLKTFSFGELFFYYLAIAKLGNRIDAIVGGTNQKDLCEDIAVSIIEFLEKRKAEQNV